MCTMIAQQVMITGSGKAGANWFKVDTASVSYDHPFDMPLEYTLNLDFTTQAGNPGSACGCGAGCRLGIQAGRGDPGGDEEGRAGRVCNWLIPKVYHDIFTRKIGCGRLRSPEGRDCDNHGRPAP